MSNILTVPVDEVDYPTLGPLVVDWMHKNLVFGPGDLLGQPLVLSAEQQAFIWRFYEVMPKDHPESGRRRFKRCAISIAKGLAKTELAAFVAIAELAPDAPVRFAEWDGDDPTGRPVTDPMVILCAFSEQQSDELCFGAMRRVIMESPSLEDKFRVGLDKIQRKNGNGKAVSVASSPSGRDGARTTFCVQDETHHWTSDRLRKAHQVLIANLPKRPIADPWSLEVTTAPEPGLKSVAEETMDFAKAIADGKVRDQRLFYYHRECSDELDLNTEEGARAGVIEASGCAAEWRDIDGVVSMWADPTTDRRWWQRVWCNKLVRSSMQAFDMVQFKKLGTVEPPVEEGSFITLGFDGAQFNDSTAIVATDVESGRQWVVDVWEQPFGSVDWQVPVEEVNDTIDDMFTRFQVWRLYADPPYWQGPIANWKNKYGEKCVIEWWTNRRSPMTRALENYDTSIKTGVFTHDGDDRLIQHMGNSFRHDIPIRDDEGKRCWLIRKERPDSPRKIDCAMAAVLSWEARTDCIASGESKQEEFFVL